MLIGEGAPFPVADIALDSMTREFFQECLVVFAILMCIPPISKGFSNEQRDDFFEHGEPLPVFQIFLNGVFVLNG